MGEPLKADGPEMYAMAHFNSNQPIPRCEALCSGALTGNQRREIEEAIRKAKRLSRGRNGMRSRHYRRRRWWRNGAGSYQEAKFKWFPVIEIHGSAYFIDFRDRAFRRTSSSASTACLANAWWPNRGARA